MKKYDVFIMKKTSRRILRENEIMSGNENGNLLGIRQQQQIGAFVMKTFAEKFFTLERQNQFRR
jgi:hypothetical protein